MVPVPLKLEVKSSRTFLASRTHFEVLGIGLKGQVLDDSKVFDLLKMRQGHNDFFVSSPEIPRRICVKTFFYLFFYENTCAFCPWPLAFLFLT